MKHDYAKPAEELRELGDYLDEWGSRFGGVARDAAAALAHVGEMEKALDDAVRTWTFGDARQPTHSWRDREDWYERHAVAREVRAALRSGGEDNT